MKDFYLACGDMERFKKRLEEMSVRIPASEADLGMRGQYPSTAEELAKAKEFFGLRVVEDTTLPKDMVVLKDSFGFMLRLYRI